MANQDHPCLRNQELACVDTELRMELTLRSKYPDGIYGGKFMGGRNREEKYGGFYDLKGHNK